MSLKAKNLLECFVCCPALGPATRLCRLGLLQVSRPVEVLNLGPCHKEGRVIYRTNFTNSRFAGCQDGCIRPSVASAAVLELLLMELQTEFYAHEAERLRLAAASAARCCSGRSACNKCFQEFGGAYL